MSLPPRSWRCATRGRCARKSRPSPKSCALRATTPAASASAAIPARAASTPIWSIRLGAAGTRGAAPRPKISTPWPCLNWIGWPPSASRFYSFCATWIPMPPICRRRRSSACSITATNSTAKTSPCSPSWRSSRFAISLPAGCRPASRTRTTSSPNTTAPLPIWMRPSSPSSPPWQHAVSPKTPSSSSTATTARRSTTTSVTSTTTVCTSRPWPCR